MNECPKILGRTAQDPNEVNERAATELKAVGEKGFDRCASGLSPVTQNVPLAVDSKCTTHESLC